MGYGPAVQDHVVVAETERSGFFVTPKNLWSRRDISATEKAVYMVIIDRMGRNSVAWPGYRLIADDCGISKTTAMRAVRRLCELGLLNVAAGSSRSSNRYSTTESSPAVESPMRADEGSTSGTGWSTSGTELYPPNSTHRPVTARARSDSGIRSDNSIRIGGSGGDSGDSEKSMTGIGPAQKGLTDRVWGNSALCQIVEAWRWDGRQYKAQRPSACKNLAHIAHLDDRDHILRQWCSWVTDIRADMGVESPVKVWQWRVTKYLKTRGINDG